MVRLEEELLKFRPIDLKTLEAKLGDVPDEVHEAVSMYNKALEGIKNGNEDMAIIALKKAISLYPAFYEAMNLMGLCHLRLGEEETAHVLFSHVVKMDDSGLRAKDFLDKLDGVQSESGHSQGAKRPKSRSGQLITAWLKRGLSSDQSGTSGLKYFAGIIIGAILVGLVWQFAGDIPLIDIDRTRPELEARILVIQGEKAALQQQLKDALMDLESANRIHQNLVEEMEVYKAWVQRVAGLREMMTGALYRDLVQKIEQDYRGLDVPPDIKSQIEAIHDEALPLALVQIYESASELYRGNARAQEKSVYQQAMKEFEAAILLMEQLEEKPEFASELYFTAAKAYWLAGLPNQEEASRMAVETFEKVIALSPGTSRARNATAWIREIQAGRAVRH